MWRAVMAARLSERERRLAEPLRVISAAGAVTGLAWGPDGRLRWRAGKRMARAVG
jgi:hypothetical protein